MKQYYLVILVVLGISGSLCASAQESAARELPLTIYGKSLIPESPATIHLVEALSIPLSADQSVNLQAEGGAATQRLDSARRVSANASYADQKTVYAYNTFGFLVEATTYAGTSTARWTQSYHTLYSYDTAGNRLEARRETYSGGAYTLSALTTYTYGEDGSLTTSAYAEYSGGEAVFTRTEEYDAGGRLTLCEAYAISEGEQTLQYTYTYAYDENDRQTLDKAVVLTETGYETTLYAYAYGDTLYSDGFVTSYEYLHDSSSEYVHTIHDFTYGDRYSGYDVRRDTTIVRTDSMTTQTVEAYRIDLTFNEQGYPLTQTGYPANGTTGKRDGMASWKYEIEYDEANRVQTVLKTDYTWDTAVGTAGEKSFYNFAVDAIYQYAYAYDEDGRSYEYMLYGQGVEIEGESDEEETEDDTDTASGEDETEEDLLTLLGGYRREYSGTDTNYTCYEYSWNRATDDWEATAGYWYIYESDGDDRQYVSAIWDPESDEWTAAYSFRERITEGHPETHAFYELDDSADTWELTYTYYYYYDGPQVTATKAIELSDSTRVYERDGVLHVVTSQATLLRVYAISGTCVYAATVNGHTMVTGLAQGIYVVVLDNETCKVRVH